MLEQGIADAIKLAQKEETNIRYKPNTIFCSCITSRHLYWIYYSIMF